MDILEPKPARLAHDLITPWGTYVKGLAVRVGMMGGHLVADLDNGFRGGFQHLVSIRAADVLSAGP